MKKLMYMVVLVGMIGGATAEAIPPLPAPRPIPITTVPFNIVTPGSYYFPADIVVPDAAVVESGMDVDPVITVSASNVTIDLRGHTYSGSTDIWRTHGSTPFDLSPVGFAVLGSNVSIANGNIVGFYIGILTMNYTNESFPDTDHSIIKGIQVNNVRFSDAQYGLFFQQTTNSTVQYCRFSNTYILDSDYPTPNTFIDNILTQSNLYLIKGSLTTAAPVIASSRPYTGK